MTYHHGNLREDLLEAAAKVLARSGPDALSLRALARQLGVSHTAPRHHFGDRRGLITAVATHGYLKLASSLEQAGTDFLAAGVAYVAFALDHPGHFSVMFSPDLVNSADPELTGARAAARSALVTGAAAHAGRSGQSGSGAESPSLPPYALLAWGATHGIAQLALAGSMTALGVGSSRSELLAAARESLQLLGPE